MKYLTILLLLLCSLFNAEGKPSSECPTSSPPPGTITGPNTATVGVPTTYKFTNGTTVSSPSWPISDDATLMSTWVSGTDYFASIRWNVTTDFTIIFKSGTVTQATKFISALPGDPTGQGATRCGSGSVSLTASPGAGATSIRWYDALTGGNLVSTGTSYSPSVSTTTTFYIKSYDPGWGYENSSARVAVTATVNAVPSPATGSGTSICGSGSVTLSASIGANGNLVRWYNASSGGSLLAENSSYTTPTLGSTTTYYVSSFNSITGCESTILNSRVPLLLQSTPPREHPAVQTTADVVQEQFLCQLPQVQTEIQCAGMMRVQEEHY